MRSAFQQRHPNEQNSITEPRSLEWYAAVKVEAQTAVAKARVRDEAARVRRAAAKAANIRTRSGDEPIRTGRQCLNGSIEAAVPAPSSKTCSPT